MRRLLSIIRIDIIEVPGESRPRQRHRPNYSDPPSHSVDFIRQAGALTPTELMDFDAWCLQRALPLNLDSLWAWDRQRQAWSPLPARYTGPERRRVK